MICVQINDFSFIDGSYTSTRTTRSSTPTGGGGDPLIPTPVDPDPTDPVDPDPIDPINPDPENPDPINPDEPDPENPDTPDPENPEEPGPDEPDDPDPEEPDEPDPEEPEEPEPEYIVIDPSTPTSEIMDLINNVTVDGSVIEIKDVTIDDIINIVASVTVTGDNAGVPQNYARYVIMKDIPSSEIADLINSIHNDGVTVTIKDSTIDNSISVTSSVTLNGDNAGVPQNFRQIIIVTEVTSAEVAELINNIKEDNLVVKLKDIEVSDEIELTSSTTINGMNAGIPQNFKQSV